MSNEEKIRNMTRWEMAEFIHDVSSNAIEITTCKSECAKCEKSDAWCISNIGEWLMRESEQ